MNNSVFSAASFFRASALLYTISVPGHCLQGLMTLYPAVNSIPMTSPKQKIGQNGARVAWDIFNTSLLVSGKPSVLIPMR
jgi:hypothetical protein